MLNPSHADPAWNTFTALHDANLNRLKTMLDELPKPSSSSPTSSVREKVAAFWHAANDEGAIEAAGLKPLAPLLELCDGAATDRTVAVAKLQADYGVNVFFAIDEGPDDKQSDWTLLQIYQGGLGLCATPPDTPGRRQHRVSPLASMLLLSRPDRDYYFEVDKEETRQLYVAHVADTLERLGDTVEVAMAGAQAVITLETTLAAAQLTRTEMRDPDLTYNKMSVGKFSAMCKGAIDWVRSPVS